MDGFTESSVIVLAATNRGDLLDPALLRPGRFDRTIPVPPPDRRGRTRILELVGRRHDFGPDVDFVALARRTSGMTGADLAALVNEVRARSHPFRRRGDQRRASRIGAGHDRARTGTPLARHQHARPQHQRMARGGSHRLRAPRPVRRGSGSGDDRARGGTGGTTWLVEGDDLLVTRTQAQAGLIVAMGGRAGEEILLEGDFTSGSSQDFAGARSLATQMVTRFGWELAASPTPVDPVGDEPPHDARAAVDQLLEDSMLAARALSSPRRRCSRRLPLSWSMRRRSTARARGAASNLRSGRSHSHEASGCRADRRPIASCGRLDIPRLVAVKRRVGCAVGPGGVFVVEGAVAEAAVEDADEAVGEGSEGLVVGVAGGSALVVEARGRRGWR